MRSTRTLLAAAALSAIASVPSQAQIATQDQLSQYFDKTTSTFDENLGGFTYDAASDTWWTATFTGQFQSIRKIVSDGSGGYIPAPLTSGSGDPAGGLVTAPDWLSFMSTSDVANGVVNNGWTRTSPTPGNILLNPTSLTVGGTTYAPGTIAFVNNAGLVMQDTSGEETINYPQFSKVLYTYDLREIGAAQNPGGLDYNSNGTIDWNDVFNEHVNRDAFNVAAGKDATDTGSANLARSFKWSTDGQSIYMVDAGSSFGGVYKIDATMPGSVTKIFTATSSPDRINTEPGVMHTSIKSLTGVSGYVGDQLIVEGSTDGGNGGGISVLIDANGSGAWEEVPLISRENLEAFLQTSGPGVITSTTDSQGNIYFMETDNDAIYKIDTAGRISKVVGEREIETFQTAVAGRPSFANSLDLQVRTTSHTTDGETFQITELLYNDATIDAPIGVKVFKTGDFNRDNIVDGTDIDLFKAAIQTVGTPGTSDATERFDLNGNAAASNTSSRDAFSIVDYNDVKILQQFYAFNDGDANMDQSVDFSDATTVVNNFGQTGKTWLQGDFTGDDNVDFADATVLVNTFGTAAELSEAPIQFDGTVPAPAPAIALAAFSAEIQSIEPLLEVDVNTGEIRILGDGLAISGFSIKSESGSLIADADGNPTPFSIYWTNGENEVAASTFSPTGVELGSGLALDPLFDSLGAEDLVFQYALLGEAAVDGSVQYVPEPTSLLLLTAGSLCLIRRRRRD